MGTAFPHKGANTVISNLYNNDLYIRTRSSFLNNFEVVNRPFTPEVVEQFLNQEDLNRLGPRKYIYNPLVWDNEESYKLVHDRLNSGKWQFDHSQIETITSRNHEKIAYGEQIVLKPMKILDLVDAE